MVRITNIFYRATLEVLSDKLGLAFDKNKVRFQVACALKSQCQTNGVVALRFFDICTCSSVLLFANGFNSFYRQERVFSVSRKLENQLRPLYWNFIAIISFFLFFFFFIAFICPAIALHHIALSCVALRFIE